MARWIANNAPVPGLLCAAVLATWLAAPVARADGAADAAHAQALFDEARALMKQGDYATACSKLAQSQTLDPGGGTLLNLGICHAEQGRTATAFAELGRALAQAKSEGRADRERTAQKHLDALAPDLCHLTLVAPQSAGSEGLIVELDGSPVDSTQLGSAIAVDPGPHQVRASARGHEPWSATITIAAARDQQRIEVPTLAPEAPRPAPVVMATPIRQTPPVLQPAQSTEPNAPLARSAPPPRADAGTPRWAGIATLGFGAAAVGVGSYFGIRALTLKSDSNQYFVGSHCTEDSCVQDWNDAKHDAVYSDVAFGVGLASLAVGTYLVLTSKKEQHAAQRPTIFFAGTRSGATLLARTEF
jgi:hypothetical protein